MICAHSQTCCFNPTQPTVNSDLYPYRYGSLTLLHPFDILIAVRWLKCKSRKMSCKSEQRSLYNSRGVLVATCLWKVLPSVRFVRKFWDARIFLKNSLNHPDICSTTRSWNLRYWSSWRLRKSLGWYDKLWTYFASGTKWNIIKVIVNHHCAAHKKRSLYLLLVFNSDNILRRVTWANEI